MSDDEKLQQAAVNAMKATNLCTLHMEYHGQKTEDCTPQERVMITFAPNQVTSYKENV